MENPKLLAVETSTKYLSNVDPSIPHSSNIYTLLRPDVMDITCRILGVISIMDHDELNVSSSAPSQQKAKNNNNHAKNDQQPDWKQCLEIYSNQSTTAASNLACSSEKGSGSPSKSKELSRRSQARMEAFLDGLALVLPDDTLPCITNVTPKPKPASAPERVVKRLSNALPASLVSQFGSDAATIDDNESLAKQQQQEEKEEIKMESSSSKNSRRVRYLYPQIPYSDLVLRLEIYFKSLSRVVQSSTANNDNDGPTVVQECAIANETSKSLRIRVSTILTSFLQTVNCITTIHPILTNLLNSFTKELLSVNTLSRKLDTVISNLISEYEMQTSFASIAFLSSPSNSTNVLEPLLEAYCGFLKQEWEGCVFDCELEYMMQQSLDGRIRKEFQHCEFTSIGHLLDFCEYHEGFLRNIHLPEIHTSLVEYGGSSSSSMEEKERFWLLDGGAEHVKQALRDLRRETITVNGCVLPPAHSVRQLIHFLKEMLDGDMTTHSNNCGDVMLLGLSSSGEESLSSGNEADVSTDEGGNNSTRRSSTATMTKKPLRRRRSFDVQTIDKLTLRLMMASSRTGSGGDAFFAVQDLFGGDDVVVVASTPSSPSSNNKHKHRTARKDRHPQQQPATQKRKKTKGTIEIIVRLSTVTIQLHGKYHVYPKNITEENVEPLIQLHTTTSEVISLREVRVRDANSTEDAYSHQTKDQEEEEEEDEGSNGGYMLQEKITETTGKRSLCIRPARYKKVQVFNTPS